MTELESLQIKMNALEKSEDFEVWSVLNNCVDMLKNGGDKKAVSAFLQIAVYFYGKERIADGIRKYRFSSLKKTLHRLGGN